MDPSEGHLNGILDRVGGNLNNNFQKSQMPGGLPGGGMLKLRFERYITVLNGHKSAHGTHRRDVTHTLSIKVSCFFIEILSFS